MLVLNVVFFVSRAKPKLRVESPVQLEGEESEDNLKQNGAAQMAGSAGSDSPGEEEDEEILGSDDDEQEDPKDYKKGIDKLCVLWHCF